MKKYLLFALRSGRVFGLVCAGLYGLFQGAQAEENEHQTIDLVGRIMADGQSGTSNFDFDARSLRLGFEGIMSPRIAFKAVAELSSGEAVLKDGYLSYQTGGSELRIGQFKSSNSLEEITSFTDILFLERASFTDDFNFGRYPGIAVRKNSSRWAVELGLFYPTSGGIIVASRGHMGGELPDGKWFLGGSFRLIRPSRTDAGEVQPQQSDAYAIPLLDTVFRHRREHDFFRGFEAALQSGRFHMASEWSKRSQRHATARVNTDLSAGYLEAGWFLTGEKRPLLLDEGKWGRPVIQQATSEGGVGAWQLAGRFDWIEKPLEEAGKQMQKKLQSALHWYPEQDRRLTVQYEHRFFSRLTAMNTTPRNASHEVAIRFQLTW